MDINQQGKRMIKTHDELWAIAKHAALQVEFLSNGRDLFLYTHALYTAMMWGWSARIEERRKKTSEEDELLTL